VLALGALLHDSGKPATRSIGADGRIHFYGHEAVSAELARARCEALRLSNEETARVVGIAMHHMRPMMLSGSSVESGQVSRRAVYRFWKATGDAGLDVCIVALADHLGMVGAHFDLQDWLAHVQVVGALLDGYLERREELVAPPPLITGRDLMHALHLKPGPLVGRLLAAISEAQAAGEVATAEQALTLAQSLRDVLPTGDEAEQGSHSPL
jgi:hypothetical protein